MQSALKKRVPDGVIRLNKKLKRMEDLDHDGVKLSFEDGTDIVVDLVVGGDGIRSVVRDHIFPDHSIKFTGTIIWRVLIPVTEIKHIPELTGSTSWWHGPTGHVYHSFVDDPEELEEGRRMFEIAARRVVDPETVKGKTFSWGIPATKERVESHFVVSRDSAEGIALTRLDRTTTPGSENCLAKSRRGTGKNSRHLQVQGSKGCQGGTKSFCSATPVILYQVHSAQVQHSPSRMDGS